MSNAEGNTVGAHRWAPEGHKPGPHLRHGGSLVAVVSSTPALESSLLV